MTGTREDTETTNGIRPLTPEDNGYKKALIASLCSGLASYNALYATQAVLPALSEDFGVSPSLAALTVSATTGGLALMVIPLSIVSERFGRRRVIQASVLAATLFSLALVTLPSIQSIIAVRLLQGIAVAGVPAVTMAFLSEEIDRRYLPRIMGFYIAGNSLGGLIGRLIPGIALEFTDWRLATLLSAIFAFAMALMTTWVLPKQRFFTPKKITLAHELQAFANHLRDPIPAEAFPVAVPADGQFRFPVQLHDLPADQHLRPAGIPRRARVHHLLVGHLDFHAHGHDGQSLRPGEGRGRLHRPGTGRPLPGLHPDCPHYARSRATVHRHVLPRPLDLQRVGRRGRTAGSRRGFEHLHPELLPRFLYHRLGLRLFLRPQLGIAGRLVDSVDPYRPCHGSCRHAAR